MKIFLTAVFLLFLFRPLSANSTIILRDELVWSPAPKLLPAPGGAMELWSFQNAVTSDEHPNLPVYVHAFALEGYGSLKVTVADVIYEDFNRRPGPYDSPLGETLQIKTAIEQARGQYFGKLSFIPIIREGSRFRRVKAFELRITWEPQAAVALRGPDFTTQSRLSDGTIYKFSVQQEGLHKLTYDFLKNDLKIDIDRVDPRQIKILGNGGGKLPERIQTDRKDDLEENAIFISGETDGKFDAGDYILFYAQGPDAWVFDPASRRFSMQKNTYDQRNYYFLKISSDAGLRVSSQNSLANTAYSTTAFDDYAHYEEDKVNLLKEWAKSKGSGQRWFGEQFKNLREYRFDKLFRFPNLVPESPVYARAEMAVRALQQSRFTLLLNGATLTSALADRIVELEGELDNIRDYAKNAFLEGTLSLNRDEIDVIVRYPNPGGANDGSEGWLDYIELNARRRLVMSGDQMAFRDVQSLQYPSTTFQLSGTITETIVWDITDPLKPRLQAVERSGDQLRFGTTTASLRQFTAFNPSKTLLTPKAVGKVDNQNLHAITRADLLILYPTEFAEAAQRLASHRRQHNKYEVALVPVHQVYNEFSSGRLDPTAFRDFARMLYTRDPKFRYLLLFGDGSFDARNLYGAGNNFVPTYQRDDYNPLFAFPSDDYYALLEETTFDDPLEGRLQLAVGRLPVKSPEEAGQVVDKIIHYDTSPTAFSDWRNRLLFVGDDEDGMQHTRDADVIADDVSRLYPALNIDKVYLDAFPQVSTTAGNRFPSVTEAINRSIFKGVLAVTYLGHGGPNGWAQERVLSIPDITNWSNFDRQPLFITATCSFTDYDDPFFTSAGEETLLNPRGGAIALMTTTRAVFANQNAALTERTLETMFQRQGGRHLTLGEIIQNAKNSFSSSGITINSRKFTLIGDPSMFMAIPEYQVQTTLLDNQPVSSARRDTLRALQRLTVEGQLIGADGQVLNGFNGVIYPTVFDKKLDTKTLGQDLGSFQYAFTLQKNVIFRGRATVQNGRFRFTFVVPKDINYAFGPGKISYYAADTVRNQDAAGEFDDFIIGGNSASQLTDRQGPQVDVFLNSFDFVSGGVTNANPVLLARVSDDNGINVVGNSIGHDLEGILDDNTQNSLLLNDFFTAALDDYTKGEVRYPLQKLSDGLHRVRVKAWDVANNASEGYAEFVVASSAGIALEHVLNYPNPFTDRTCFQFDHSMANQEMQVLIQIFTVSGRLVKTIEQTIFSDGALRRDDCIEWDGRDDYGDPLARGVYLYKINVKAALPGAETVRGESKFEKLVILK